MSSEININVNMILADQTLHAIDCRIQSHLNIVSDVIYRGSSHVEQRKDVPFHILNRLVRQINNSRRIMYSRIDSDLNSTLSTGKYRRRRFIANQVKQSCCLPVHYIATDDAIRVSTFAAFYGLLQASDVLDALVNTGEDSLYLNLLLERERSFGAMSTAICLFLNIKRHELNVSYYNRHYRSVDKYIRSNDRLLDIDDCDLDRVYLA